MRKALLFLLMLLALLLCACTRETHPSVYEVEQNGRVYTVDRENGVLTCGGQTYQYCVDKDGSIEILYPDGATFWWTVRGNTGFGGWSDDYTERERVPGEELLEVLGHEIPRSSGNGAGGGGNALFALAALGFGIWGLAAPYSAWYAAYGWWYQDAKPSVPALTAERVGGIVLIVVGLIAFFS